MIGILQIICIKKKMKKIKKNNFGFYQVYPAPNKKRLEKYYKEKYFDKNISYKSILKPEEENYHKCISAVKIFMLNKKIKKLKNKSLLDIGAGQGTFLNNIKMHFKKCTGVDFSSDNFLKKNKFNIDFISINPEDFIKKNDLKKFDIITLNNVLEHVPDPINLLKKLKLKIKKKTYLILTVPNDFSKLQKETNKKVLKKNYWVSPPEHLNYFNTQNFVKFSNKMGFKIVDAISDFPIELFLLKKDFDYTKNPILGKKIHLLRCEIISYLENNSSKQLIYEFLKIIYKLDIGRDNIYLLQKK